MATEDEIKFWESVGFWLSGIGTILGGVGMVLNLWSHSEKEAKRLKAK